MKTIETNNQALLEVLAKNGVEIICNEKMQMVITDGADKISEIVAKYAPAANNDYCINEVGYMIDYTDGSGSDTIFDTYEDAERHMSVWTEKERQGCEIVEVER